MDSKQAIIAAFAQADMIVDGYLADLAPQDMLARACDGNNHVAWQVGHLIASERYLVDKVAPGKMRPLPDGFAERHKTPTACKDEASCFDSKEMYGQLKKAVRADAISAINALPPAELDKPAPAGVPPFCKTIGEVLVFLPTHWLMHAGQWAVTRRKLGRKPLF